MSEWRMGDCPICHGVGLYTDATVALFDNNVYYTCNCPAGVAARARLQINEDGRPKTLLEMDFDFSTDESHVEEEPTGRS